MNDQTEGDAVSARARIRWLAVVAGGALAVVALNIWWVATYRHNFPLTIDEAGYISIALVDHFGLQSGGPHGWWEAVQSQVPQAPLVPALTSLVFSVKTGVLEGFGVLIGFLALLTFASYGIGERLAGPRLGALAALIVATSPGAFIFAREYVFAMAVAALLSCTVYALLRSEGLRSRRWAIVCGIALGLMLLSRTMTIAFVPGVVLAALVSILARAWRPERPRGELAGRFLNLALLVVSGTAVAATWYIRNFHPVLEYLTGYGYGAQSAYYGPNHSLFSWFRWRDVASRMTFNDLLVPLAVMILLGVAAVIVLAARRVLGAPDRRSALIRLLASDAFTVGVVFACCYIALTSSRNGGEGFTFPLAVLLPPLAVISLKHIRRGLIPVLAALLAITALNVASTSNLSDSLSRMQLVSIPGFEPLPWTNGISHAISAIRAQMPGPESRFVERDHGWTEDDKALAGVVVKAGEEGVNQPVAFASRNRALNTSTLLLSSLLTYHEPFWLAQLNPEPADTVATYVHELSSPELGMPGILVTMSSNRGDFPPLVTQRYAETAARRLHFHKVRTITLPDGRLMFVWFRRVS